jgi:RimJ/RimL family protein N-acetyltransferase
MLCESGRAFRHWWAPAMIVLETSRLRLRHLTFDDAAFMLTLLNDPSFHANIGDRGVRTLDDARRFLQAGHVASYERNGYGHYLVELKRDDTPIGTCGLIKRDFIGEIDLGFAYLPAYWSQGYATEAATAVMDYGRNTLGIQRIVAVVSPGNTGSIRVLEKLGLKYAGLTRLAADAEYIHLYS